MVADKRRQEILQLIERYGSIRISNLGKMFDVTDMTIRRDIDHLSEQGLVRRVHGGAVHEGSVHERVPNGTEQNLNLATTFLKRNREYVAQKKNIGALAQDFVEDGKTIIIDGGSTNECFARMIDPKKKLRIITHGINIAWILSGNENHDLFVAGGILNRLTMTFSGAEVREIYGELNADTLFIAASGLSLDKGLTDPSWYDTSIKKTMIRASKKVILLIDSHKFNLISSRTFASIDELDCIVTDEQLDPFIGEKYTEAGVNLLLA